MYTHQLYPSTHVDYTTAQGSSGGGDGGDSGGNGLGNNNSRTCTLLNNNPSNGNPMYDPDQSPTTSPPDGNGAATAGSDGAYETPGAARRRHASMSPPPVPAAQTSLQHTPASIKDRESNTNSGTASIDGVVHEGGVVSTLTTGADAGRVDGETPGTAVLSAPTPSSEATIAKTTAAATATTATATTMTMAFDPSNAFAERDKVAKIQAQAAVRRLRRKRREKEKVAAAEAAVNEAAKAAARPSEQDMVAFNEKTAGRVVAHARAIRKATIKEKLARQKTSTKYADFDGEAFRRETHARVQERTALQNQLEPGQRPAKIAIVGAGPAGLWIAITIAREHASLLPRAGMPARIAKPAGAPTIDIFERRNEGAGGGYVLLLLPSSLAACNHAPIAFGYSGVYTHSNVPLVISLEGRCEQYLSIAIPALLYDAPLAGTGMAS